MNCISPAAAAFLVTIGLFLVFNAEGTEAKRGCSAFGHSCYGGMGKRIAEDVDTVSDEILQDIPQEKNVEQFPQPAKNTYGKSDSEILPPLQYFRISPILRQMLQSYKKLQAMRNNGDI